MHDFVELIADDRVFSALIYFNEFTVPLASYLPEVP